MDLTKLYKVLVLGGALAAGCGTMPSKADSPTNQAESADAGLTAADGGTDGGEVVADAGEPAEETGGGVCPWAGMNPCPC